MEQKQASFPFSPINVKTMFSNFDQNFKYYLNNALLMTPMLVKQESETKRIDIGKRFSYTIHIVKVNDMFAFKIVTDKFSFHAIQKPGERFVAIIADNSSTLFDMIAKDQNCVKSTLSILYDNGSVNISFAEKFIKKEQ